MTRTQQLTAAQKQQRDREELLREWSRYADRGPTKREFSERAFADINALVVQHGGEVVSRPADYPLIIFQAPAEIPIMVELAAIRIGANRIAEVKRIGGGERIINGHIIPIARYSINLD
jgi:hypothetical protein